MSFLSSNRQCQTTDDDYNQAYSQYKHSLTFRVVKATKPVHRLQIRPTVNN